VEEYQREIKNLELEMLDLQSEMNRIKHMKSNFSKDEKMIKQMLKTNEVQIRSMEKENSTLKRKFGILKKSNEKLEKGIKLLVNETMIRGAKKQDIKELVDDVSQIVDLDELFEDNGSVDTEEELRISIDESLKEYQEQLQTLREKRAGKPTEGVKKTLVDCDQISNSLDSLSSQNNPTVVNSKPYKRALSPIEKERENSQFKLRLESEIEENIKSRSRRNRDVKGTMTVKKKSNTSGQRKSDKNKRNCKSDLESSSNLGGDIPIESKDQLFLKCKIMNPEIFETYEKNKIEMRIRTMKGFSDFIMWLWEYFEEKCERLTTKIREIQTEKSKYFGFTNL
jgi:ElaB/YqjD/DUF883 family membrane-anchored ribosome-binding protein